MSAKTLIAFSTSAGGLEKILRLLQSIVQILAAVSVEVEQRNVCGFARQQLALGRRYFRFFRFLEAFVKAYEVFMAEPGLVGTLGVAKWSCLGAYLFLESCTILDAMSLTNSPWAPRCMLEANKFWLYSLLLSILLGIYQLYLVDDHGFSSMPPAPAHEEKVKRHGRWVSKFESEEEREIKRLRRIFGEERLRLKRRLVADACDVFIPGAATGWLVASPAVVGAMMAVSTVLSSGDVWEKLSGKGD